MLNKRDFLRYALTLALPVMVQNLISTMVNTADTIMLGFVSQEAMSASSLANQYTFVLACFYYGLGTATSVLCAQYYGKKDIRTIERTLGLGARLSLLISGLFFAAGFFFPELIMKLFTNSPQTVAQGTVYLRIISLSFVFMGLSEVYTNALRSMGKVFVPSLTYAVSLVVNVIINATFIFGLFGAPKLGIVGVAIGTVTARVAEFAICLIHSMINDDIHFRIRYIFSGCGVLFRDFMNISLPAVGNDVIWSMATAVFAAILGHIGDDMVAANTVAVMVVNIGAIAERGFAGATTIVVSQSLGKNKIEEAKEYGRRMLWLTIILSLVGGGVILCLRPLMMGFYADKLTPTAISYLGTIMIMSSWRLLGDGINTCLICGCFRGGGDARFGMITDTFFMWAVAVPLMAAGAFILKLPPLGVYFIMSLDEYYKLPVVLIHYKKYKWLNNITREFD